MNKPLRFLLLALGWLLAPLAFVGLWYRHGNAIFAQSKANG